MKLKILFVILIVLFLVGCKAGVDKTNENASVGEGTSVDENVTLETPVENETTSVEPETAENETVDTTEPETTEEIDNKKLFEELLGGGDEEEEVVETPESGLKNVIIENFRGEPEDFSITAGTTVKWTNLMYNYQQIIIILPKNDDGTYSSHWINDLVELNTNESYEYVFNESGNYKWGSKTKFEKIQGIITVK